MDILMTDMADDKDACRRIAYHLPVDAARDEMEFKERCGKIVVTPFAGIFHGDLALLFLHGSDPHAVCFRHDGHESLLCDHCERKIK